VETSKNRHATFRLKDGEPSQFRSCFVGQVPGLRRAPARHQPRWSTTAWGGRGFVRSNFTFTRNSLLGKALQTQKRPNAAQTMSLFFKKPVHSHEVQIDRHSRQAAKPPTTPVKDPPGGGVASFVQIRNSFATGCSERPYKTQKQPDAPKPCRHFLERLYTLMRCIRPAKPPRAKPPGILNRSSSILSPISRPGGLT